MRQILESIMVEETSNSPFPPRPSTEMRLGWGWGRREGKERAGKREDEERRKGR